MPAMSGQSENRSINRFSANNNWKADDEIVISGVSGKFPESDNINQLKDNLFNHVDMVTQDDRRWPQGMLFVINVIN